MNRSKPRTGAKEEGEQQAPGKHRKQGGFHGDRRPPRTGRRVPVTFPADRQARPGSPTAPLPLPGFPGPPRR